MKLVKLVPAFMILGLALMACGGSNGGGGATAGKKIALLLPEAQTARYDTKDMPYFKAKLAALCSNCTLIYSNAKQDAPTQQTQAEAAITNGANVIVLDPVDGAAAAAIVTTPEIAKAMGKQNLVSVKALQLSVSNGSESGHNSWDGSYFHTTRIASKKAYEEAGIKSPRDEVSMFEVHDCFSVTELVTMEDLHISETGKGWKDVLDGFYDADGKIPCQIDGGLKCFGHPIGASGLRMLYEMYLQFQGRAGARQLKDPRIGMTHNLGGAPRENVSSVAIVGRYE